MSMLSPIQQEVLKQVVYTLNTHNIPFQVHGGLAAMAYGAKRPLYDIDLDVRRADLVKVRELFKEYLVQDITHESDGEFDLYLMTININGIPVDFDQIEETYYVDKDGQKIRMDPDLSKAKMMDIDGITVPVQDKQELIAYKKIVARDTDLEDIKQIL